MNDLVFLVVRLVVTVVATLIGVYLIPILRNWLQTQQNKEIYDMIKTAVKAAEQTIKGSGKGSIKKDEVLTFISEWLTERGLEVSQKQLDLLIESAVFAMNNSLGEIL